VYAGGEDVPWVSTATEYAWSSPLAVPLSVCCQSGVPSRANFCDCEVVSGAGILGVAGGDDVALVVHRHRIRRVINDGAVEGLLPEESPVAANFATKKSDPLPLLWMAPAASTFLGCPPPPRTPRY
jgi:hypothetical protein